MNFWQNLNKPIIGLAPMDGVTDFPYRVIQARHGKPDVSFTEFIPVEGIVRLSEKLLMDFWYSAEERPIIAQVYGNKPEMFYCSAQLVCELGFDGVDINMGCPARSVVHSGSGAALIKNPELAVEIIKAVQQGVIDWVENNGIVWKKWQVLDPEVAKKTFEEFVTSCKAKGFYQDLDWEKNQRQEIPVSVKTRIGFSHPVVEEWIPTLLETNLAAITVHGRTLKQLYTGLANWEEVAKAVKLRDEINPSTLILGNGDLKSRQDLEAKMKIGQFDGYLIGRGTFGNPWIFPEARGDQNEVPTQEKFAVMLEHAHLHEQYKPGEAFVQMRKNLAWYVSGIHSAAALRAQLVRSNSAKEVEDVLHFWLRNANTSSP